jgi:3-hydroxyisobutyrate dehydrogenase-like beta-hydroxyacid dehydrogenase
MVTQDVPTLVIAVLGLGEAGSAIAQDLVRAGVRVRGYDPAVTAADGTRRHAVRRTAEMEAAAGMLTELGCRR